MSKGGGTAARRVRIAPSILTADLARLGEQIREAEAAGADAIHLDVMDGRFVPPITFGPLVVEAVRRSTGLPIEVHLMIEEPWRSVEAYVEAGAECVIVHVEAERHLQRCVEQIHAAGAQAGVTLNPATTLESVREILPSVERLQIMSVNPGWGGQAFIPGTRDKIAWGRAMLDDLDRGATLGVDGGVNAATVAAVVRAGADVVVAGSAVFTAARSVAESLAALRAAIEGTERAI